MIKKCGGFLLPSIHVGDVFTSNAGFSCTVMEYISGTKRTGGIKIKFDLSGYEMYTSSTELKSGEFKDPTTPTVCGVGFIGSGAYPCSYNHKKLREYVLWHNMIKRCYERNHSSYEEVTVCEEWYNYQNFARWCNKQVEFRLNDEQGLFFDLDKDLLRINCKTYSPETCCFLPKILNTNLTGKNCCSELPCGVYLRRGDFVTHQKQECGRIKVVKHESAKAASASYKRLKTNKLEQLANKFRDYICEQAYIALINFRIDERIIFN